MALGLFAQETRHEIVNPSQTPAADAKPNSNDVPEVYLINGHFERVVILRFKYLHGLVPGEVSKPLRLFVPLAMIAVPVVLVLMQPNLGTATLLALCGALLLFLAGLSWYWIAPTLGAVALAVPMAWQFALHDYQKQRVMTFLDPHTDALGAGWNITQAKIALGSGGIIGKGFLLGTQSRLNFLPEKETTSSSR